MLCAVRKIFSAAQSFLIIDIAALMIMLYNKYHLIYCMTEANYA